MSQQLSSRYLCGLFFLHVIFAVATLGVFCFALAAAIHSGIWFLIFFPGVFGLALAIIFGLGLPNDWTRWQNARQLKAHGGGTVAILATHLHEFNRLTGSTNYLLYEDFVCWLWRVQDLLNEGDLLAALDELEAGGRSLASKVSWTAFSGFICFLGSRRRRCLRWLRRVVTRVPSVSLIVLCSTPCAAPTTRLRSQPS